MPGSAHELLDEIRAIGQLGLTYAENGYDRERYERLLRLACDEYEDLTGIPSEQIQQKFREELGYVTPRVGLDAAIFDEEGKLLIIQRSDDLKWGLPCGWAEVGESPREGIERELQEELGVEVKAGPIIDVFSRKPAPTHQLFASYHLLFHCELVRGTLVRTEEAIDFGYFHPAEVPSWHNDHRERAECARLFWKTIPK